MSRQAGFDQVPTALVVALANERSGAAIRVTLSIVRRTIGFHRQCWAASLGDLQKATGMSRPSVISGLRRAEEAGYIERVPEGWRVAAQEPSKDSLLPSKDSLLGSSKDSLLGSSKDSLLPGSKDSLLPSIIGNKTREIKQDYRYDGGEFDNSEFDAEFEAIKWLIEKWQEFCQYTYKLPDIEAQFRAANELLLLFGWDKQKTFDALKAAREKEIAAGRTPARITALAYLVKAAVDGAGLTQSEAGSAKENQISFLLSVLNGQTEVIDEAIG